AEIINNLACRDVCKIKDWEKMKPADIDKEINRINQWAKKNANRSLIELKWDALEESLAADKSWNDEIGDRVKWLLEKKETKPYAVMKRMLEEEKTSAYEKSDILRLYFERNPVQAKDLAPKYLGAKDDELRFVAALLVFQTGEKAKAREILG